MAWTEVGSAGQGTGERSPIMKWTVAGQTVEGVYRGQREGKFGPLVIIQTPQGEEVYGAKAVLKRKLEQVTPGMKVRIEYLGKRRSQAGTEYGDFRVQKDDAPDRTEKALYDAVEFERLVGLIRKEKGDQIAKALSDVAKAMPSPVQALRDAMAQIGVTPF